MSAPTFRRPGEDHPPGRYVARQSARGRLVVLEWGGGLWVQIVDDLRYAACEPVGHTFGPLPDWPEVPE